MASHCWREVAWAAGPATRVTGLWLYVALLALQGPTATGVHTWHAAPATELAVRHTAAHKPQQQKEVRPGSVLRPPEDAMTEPEPTSLGGFSDFFGDGVRASKARPKFTASTGRPVPWWGWVIAGCAVVVLSLFSFCIGALFLWHFVKVGKNQKADETSKGGILSSLRKTSPPALEPARGQAQATPPSTTRQVRFPTLEEWTNRASPPVPSPTGNSRCLPCLPQQCGDLFTQAVKRAISVVDKKVIGVGMHIGKLRVSARHGTVEVEDLILENPEGYYSEYLLRIRKMELQVSMAKYIFSRGKTVVVEHLAVANVEVNYEKALTTSNIETVIKFTKRAKKAFLQDDDDDADEDATVTNNILGAITATSTAAASQVGRTMGAIVGNVEDLPGSGLAEHAQRTWKRASQATAVGRIAERAGNTVASTAGDFMGHTANIAGAAVFAGTALATGTAQTLERQTVGAVSTAMGAAHRGLETVTEAVGVGGASSSTDTAPAQAAPKSEEEHHRPKVAFVIKRLAISNIGVTLASNMVAGHGLTLPCGDISYEDFTATVKSTMGMDIVRFLLKATLLSAVKSLSSVHDFTLDAGHRVLDLGRTVAEEVQHGATKAIHLV